MRYIYKLTALLLIAVSMVLSTISLFAVSAQTGLVIPVQPTENFVPAFGYRAQPRHFNEPAAFSTPAMGMTGTTDNPVQRFPYMPDDAFFGVWRESGSWQHTVHVYVEINDRMTRTAATETVQVTGPAWYVIPALDYENFPGMHLVEAAAKAGDYDLARYHLLQYYRRIMSARFPDLPRAPSGSRNHRSDIMTRLMAYNWLPLVWGHNWYTIETVGETWDWVVFDATEDIRMRVSAGNQAMNTMVMAVHRDGSTAEFYSNNHPDEAYRPFLEVVVNRETRRLYPTHATYMRAGIHADTPHGDAVHIRAQESGTVVPATGSEPRNQNPEINPGAATVFDDNAKRITMIFDLSGFSPDDVITNAVLHMYGRNVAEGASGDKYVVAVGNVAVNWDESSRTWANQGHIGIFSYGEAGPNWNWHQQASPSFADEMARWRIWMEPFLDMYRYTGDETYIYHLLRLMMDLFHKQPDATWLDMGIDTGHRSNNFITSILPRIIHSQVLTPEIFATVMKYLHGSNQYLWQRWTDQSQTGWGATEASSLLTFSLYFPEFRDTGIMGYDPAVNYGWMRENGRVGDFKLRPSPGNVDNMTQQNWYDVRGMFPTGMDRQSQFADVVVNWDFSVRNNAIQYANVVLNSTSRGLEEAIGLGWDTSIFSQNILDQVHAGWRFVFYASAPGVRAVQFGNCTTHTTTFEGRMRDMYQIFGDPILQYAATGGRAGQAPPFTSSVFPDGARAVMRTGWGGDDLFWHTSWNGGIHNHGHFDDLSMIVFWGDQMLITDPLIGSYISDEASGGANWRRRWLNSHGHSMVIINDSVQRGNSFDFNTNVMRGDGRHGELLWFETNPVFDSHRARTVNVEITPGSLPAGPVYFDQQRHTLFIRDGFWIVTDYIIPPPRFDRAHKYAQNWMFEPFSNPTLDEETFSVRTNIPGARNIQVVPVETYNIEFDGFPGLDNLAPVQRVTGWNTIEGEDPETIIKNAYYSGMQMTQRANYVRRIQGDAAFSAVVYPHDVDSDHIVTSAPIILDVPQGSASAFELSITSQRDGIHRDITYFITNGRTSVVGDGRVVGVEIGEVANMTEMVPTVVGRYTVQAGLMYLERDRNGAIATLIAERVTQISDDETEITLLRSVAEIPSIAITYNGSNVEITSSWDGGNFYAFQMGWKEPVTRAGLDLAGLTLFTPVVVETLLFNGVSIPVDTVSWVMPAPAVIPEPEAAEDISDAEVSDDEAGTGRAGVVVLALTAVLAAVFALKYVLRSKKVG